MCLATEDSECGVKKKNILLAITGLAPQVVTETLNGIVDEGSQWPDEIQIITTVNGRDKMISHIFTANPGELNVLEQICQDYEMPVPVFGIEQIFVIPDADGFEVDDARTCDDQDALANFIVNHVATLCSDGNNQIHASIAGGRKTMTFFLGYAMALFSRECDRLSHVLVDAAYESNPNFYYRTKHSKPIESRDGKTKLDASLASIELADIPFIRHRNHLDTQYLTNEENKSYRDLTLFQNGSRDIDGINLNFHLIQKRLEVSGRNIPTKTLYFNENPMALAFYSMIASYIKNVRYDDTFKLASGKRCMVMAELFLQEMEKIAGLREKNDYTQLNTSRAFEIDQVTFYERASKLMNKNLVKNNVSSDTDNEIPQSYKNLMEGMSYAFFNDRRNQLITFLKTHFPSDFVEVIQPAQVYDKVLLEAKGLDNTRQLREFSTSGRQGGAYGVWIDPNNIHFKKPAMIIQGVF